MDVEIHWLDNVVGAVRVGGEIDCSFPQLEKNNEAAEAIGIR